MNPLAPIVFFAYNRPEHTRKTLQALSECRLADQSALWIYIDGPKPGATEATRANIETVKKIAAEKNWCKKVYIVSSVVNKGLFNSIVAGINEIIDRFGKIIVVEDDVLVSSEFLKYMNESLNFYEHTEKVMHISGFSRPDLRPANVTESTYFFFHTSCWGWGTWKRAWDKFVPDHLAVKKTVSQKGNISKFNMDNTYEFFWGLKAIAAGKFQGWNAIWHSTVFLKGGLCLHPARSLTANIGHDGSGVNCQVNSIFDSTEPLAEKITITSIPLVENAAVRSYYQTLFTFKYKLIFIVKHYLRYLMN